ncbi:hypothetical protein GQ44DRAFT_771428 [Phaeosphaeriaceae sp. PMI808]|nr:hypothetical protein GQ44DRAFT_771428 [Phaeosphaeriaceae sp. PMI808]
MAALLHASNARPGEAPAPSPPAGAVLQGLQVVCEGTKPVVDIMKTWTASNGVHWLHDLLLHDLPNARILSWGYNANTHSQSWVNYQSLYDHARTLLRHANRFRRFAVT